MMTHNSSNTANMKNFHDSRSQIGLPSGSRAPVVGVSEPITVHGIRARFDQDAIRTVRKNTISDWIYPCTLPIHLRGTKSTWYQDVSIVEPNNVPVLADGTMAFSGEYIVNADIQVLRYGAVRASNVTITGYISDGKCIQFGTGRDNSASSRLTERDNF
jgi:hypothetical protein